MLFTAIAYDVRPFNNCKLKLYCNGPLLKCNKTPVSVYCRASHVCAAHILGTQAHCTAILLCNYVDISQAVVNHKTQIYIEKC